jgi:tRNA pseudouridine38-40 synthase
LDVELMQEAANLFLGMKDFRSFTADDPDEKSMKALLEELRVEEAGSLVIIRVRGSHFLWNMVRRIVGVVAEVGRGKLSLRETKGFLLEASDVPATLTAPPSGLFLERVYYKGDEVESDLQPMLWM